MTGYLKHRNIINGVYFDEISENIDERFLMRLDFCDGDLTIHKHRDRLNLVVTYEGVLGKPFGDGGHISTIAYYTWYVTVYTDTSKTCNDLENHYTNANLLTKKIPLFNKRKVSIFNNTTKTNINLYANRITLDRVDVEQTVPKKITRISPRKLKMNESFLGALTSHLQKVGQIEEEISEVLEQEKKVTQNIETDIFKSLTLKVDMTNHLQKIGQIGEKTCETLERENKITPNKTTNIFFNKKEAVRAITSHLQKIGQVPDTNEGDESIIVSFKHMNINLERLGREVVANLESERLISDIETFKLSRKVSYYSTDHKEAGCDVVSFDGKGEEKYIKVITTESDVMPEIKLNKYEKDLMNRNPDQYHLCLLTDFSVSKQTAELSVYTGEEEVLSFIYKQSQL